MRLSPIDRPRSFLMRMAYQASIRQFGRVLTPFKEIYARKPRLLILAGMIDRTMRYGLSLEPGLRLLIQVQASRMNGCAFCEDLALANVVREQIGSEKFVALHEFRTSSLFSEREKAALAFAEEATRDRHVSDDTFAAVRAHFTKTEIVEISWVNAAENYFNLQAHPLGIGSDELLAATTARGRARSA